jgi:N-acetylneuraminate synthase/sialic acid synthase
LSNELNNDMQRFFRIADRVISDNSLPFVVAEIGHNHGGNLEHCKFLFRLAKEAGADAVKLQKRDNKGLYTEAAYNEIYNSTHSYGATYGQHREALEFGRDEYIQLKHYARELGLILFATAFDEASADFLELLEVPVVKIASGDLLNVPLIRHIALKRIPIILSTGGGTFEDIFRATHTMEICGASFALLYCMGTYPNRAEELNMLVIKKLRDIYPNIVIGFSSHYDGILAPVSAYHYGASIIEVHFTDSHVNKGTDHSLSLQPQGMKEMIHYLREAKKMQGNGIKQKSDREEACLMKMKKSLYPARILPDGWIIMPEDIAIKSPGGGIPPYESGRIVGKAVIGQMNMNTPLSWDRLR